VLHILVIDVQRKQWQTEPHSSAAGLTFGPLGDDMPGIPTHFKILDLTLAKLNGAPAASALRRIGNVMTANSPYAYFGAVGGAIGDFIPAGPGVLPQYAKMWQSVFDLMGGWGTPGHPGLYAILTTLTTAIDKMVAAAAAQDINQLKALQSQGKDFSDKTNAMAILFGELQKRALRILGRIAASGPAVDVPVNSPVPSPSAWSVRDVLHWKKTGLFVKALINEANKSNDDRFRAYAYGYLTSYAGKTVGSPFVNSIVLGPYRTQWWRHRWVNNWVDAWSYGSYEAGATMAGDTPTPAYAAWPSLCSANLQKKIELPGIDPVDLMNRLPKQDVEDDTIRQAQQPFPAILPPEFGDFWIRAYSDVYGAPPPDSPVQAKELNGAYLMTWLVLWFQTSAFGCNPAPPADPPGSCGTKPSWVNPGAPPGDNGNNGVPPIPNPGDYQSVNTLQVICGILLALLGVVLCAAGGAVAGVPAIVGGIAVAVNSGTVDWAKLNCDLYWYRWYLYNGLNAIHQLFSLAGLVHPYAVELGVDQTALNFAGFNKQYLSGENLCKSQQRMEGFPAAIWVPNIVDPANWIVTPTVWENPQTLAYLTAAYPSFVVDDPANPLANGEVRIGGTWPPGYRQSVGKGPVQFGNAVENAVDLFNHMDGTFPDWNLDADRILAQLTWQFQGGIYSDPVAIQQET
jgi:hypothetical protein